MVVLTAAAFLLLTSTEEKNNAVTTTTPKVTTTSRVSTTSTKPTGTTIATTPTTTTTLVGLSREEAVELAKSELDGEMLSVKTYKEGSWFILMRLSSPVDVPYLNTTVDEVAVSIDSSGNVMVTTTSGVIIK